VVAYLREVIFMAALDSIHRDREYSTLRTHEDAASGTFWCHMHERRFPKDSAYRPCFSTILLKELRDFQLRTAEVMRRPLAVANKPRVISHIVLASATDVFNLGGDLDLFCRLIRAQDRGSLMAYARQCVEVAYGFYRHINEDAHTIALVQGDALGGGFEAALCCQTIVAESGVGMGFPEVLFDLFPGMGAYSFLRRRISSQQAEQMMLDGRIYTSDELHRMGVVDILVPRGEGVAAVQELIVRNQRIAHARLAMNRVQAVCHPVNFEELMTITEIWVDTAMQLGQKSLRTMERLVRAQLRRPEAKRAAEAAANVVSISGVG
jgi:DSF synthase